MIIKEKECCLKDFKKFIGFRELKQPKNGIWVRSIEETVKEVERCFKKMGLIEKTQKSKPVLIAPKPL